MKKAVRTSSFLDCGFSNNNYLINDAFVIRIPRENGDPTLDFKKEHQVYTLLEPLHICEKILTFDETNGVKISKFCHALR